MGQGGFRDAVVITLDGVAFLDHLSSLKRRMALKKYKKHLEAMEKERLEKQNS